jgi:beta-hydroxylase
MFRLVQWFTDRLITLFSRNANRAFWDNASFPWIARIEANWKTIRDEFDRVMLEQDRIPNVEDISEDGNLGADRKPMSRGAEWKWFFLYGYDHKIEGNCIRCPQTAQLVESIPRMHCAIFAILAPGKHIPPHRGLYKGLLRYHLGVRIPGAAGLCRIKVGGETRAWEEGRGLVFDDTQTHEVWNDSDARRVVLMIDLERPLSLPLTMLNRMVIKWISSTTYITDAVQRARAPERYPRAQSTSTANAGRPY